MLDTDLNLRAPFVVEDESKWRVDGTSGDESTSKCIAYVTNAISKFVSKFVVDDLNDRDLTATMDGDDDAMWDFPDPLSFNIHEQALSLLRILPPDSHSYHALRDALASNNAGNLLSTASNLLAEPSVTVHACRAFQPILLDLCARWLESKLAPDRILEAFGLLIDVHEELYPYVVNSMY